jgi:hypothetical protein
VATFVLTRWDFKIIERELINQGLIPLVDFHFRHTNEDPLGWLIEFLKEEDALIWRLQHGHKWM